MQLTTVTFDGDLEDADEEALRGLVSDYEEAQEKNAAEFEAAKDQLQDTLGDDAEFDDILGEVEEFDAAKSDLREQITEFDSFEDSPVTEAVLESTDFDGLREYRAYFADLDADSEEEESEEFDDMGNKAPTNPDGDEDEEFAEKHLSSLAGIGPQ